MKSMEFKNNFSREKRNKYSQELIDIIWRRLANEGIENADNLIGVRNTVENVDFEKFWSTVKGEDIKSLITSYEQNKQKQLDYFEKYKDKYNEGEFVPDIGEMISQDTLWWDKKIEDLNEILKTL
jgi:hypothetical protein